MELQCPWCFRIIKMQPDRTLIPGGIERCYHCARQFVMYFIVLKDGDKYSARPPMNITSSQHKSLT